MADKTEVASSSNVGRMNDQDLSATQKSTLIAKGPGRIFVECRVCKFPIDVTEKLDQEFVRCPSCSECTALGLAPKGERYVTCTFCNGLLICRATSQLVICGRSGCHRMLEVCIPKRR